MRLLPLLALVFAAPLQAASSQVAPPDLRLQPVVSGLASPVAVRHAGDDRLFVVEQGGRIRILEAGALRPQPFLDFVAAPPPGGFSNGGERGLLGLAFAPDYSASGRLFVYYTDAGGHTLVVRFQRDGDDPQRVDPASAAVVLRVKQDFGNHNGGDLHFGPEGFLYIGLGDGGGSNDPCNRAQTLAFAALQNGGSGCGVGSYAGDSRSRALLGKLLRIDVTSTGGSGVRCGALTGIDGVPAVDYMIPIDNPYAGETGICGEVWAAGLRNPYRFSFDRLHGDLLIGDVGQGAREEIDLIAPGEGGRNFGWRCREGDIATPDVTCSGPLPAFTEPVLTYPRALGGSVTGGFRYRGPQGGLDGSYLFGDFISGRLFAAKPHQGEWRSVVWREAGGNPSGFGEDLAGDVLVLDYYGGTLARIVTDQLFADGLEPDR